MSISKSRDDKTKGLIAQSLDMLACSIINYCTLITCPTRMRLGLDICGLRISNCCNLIPNLEAIRPSVSPGLTV